MLASCRDALSPISAGDTRGRVVARKCNADCIGLHSHQRSITYALLVRLQALSTAASGGDILVVAAAFGLCPLGDAGGPWLWTRQVRTRKQPRRIRPLGSGRP